MRLKIGWIAALAVGTAVALPVTASNLFVYPQKGQSQQQQEKDEFACYQWAKKNTGVDPARASSQPRSSGGNEAARGMVGGAVSGLVIGNIAGGSGSKGAAAGAIFGGLGGAAKSSRRNSATQQQQSQSLNTYNRAYAACLEGRGYTVK